MREIKVHPFPGVSEKHISAAAQLDPWLSLFALLSESMWVCFLLDHAAEIFVVTSCGQKR